ncbi:hypothetical protein F0562_023071 [Nyssa sinensis]|uniref:Phytocyanin domain-containing protein n=1 Tax=Nyssa sinensis TaxID=561372 RepID=A0A5J5BGS4_9ASTE|nr:hypothetical protein F0562_023071 [Nyssa sinensis]
MGLSSFLLRFFLLFLVSFPNVLAFTGTYGVNYGRISDNIPRPESVVTLLKAAKIKNIRIYDADHEVLTAFKKSGIEIVVGLGNEYLKDISVSEDRAMSWVKENVEAFLPGTSIRGIAVGNEVLGSTDVELWEALLGACVFKDTILPYMRPLLQFFSQIDSPFYINAYPFLAYISDPEHIDIRYALFQSNPGIYDAKTKLHYDNMFDAQVDAAYAALEKVGFAKTEVIVSETGWASRGDQNEAGATLKNARAYNYNLRKKLAKKKGTPLRPKIAVRAYIFALFNENLKPGPTSERNFGLFKADGSISYDIGFTGLVPSSAASSHLAFKDIGLRGWLGSSYSLIYTTCATPLCSNARRRKQRIWLETAWVGKYLVMVQMRTLPGPLIRGSFVGDILMFNFTTNVHDVQEVTKDSYDACTSINSIGNAITTGPANITLNTAGDHYYICTVGGHCQAGQKLHVTVSGTLGAAPPSTNTPTTTATPSPTSGTPEACAPTPSTTPSTNGPSPPGSSSSAVFACFFLTFWAISMGFLL